MTGGVVTGDRARDALDGREVPRANGTVGGIRERSDGARVRRAPPRDALGVRTKPYTLVDEKRTKRGDGGSIERECRGERPAKSTTQRMDQRLLQPNGAERREPDGREGRVLVRERGGRVETERVSNRRVQSVVDREGRRVRFVIVRNTSNGGVNERGDVGDCRTVERERRGEARAERAFHRRVRRRRAGGRETGRHQRRVVRDVRRRARVDECATNLREDV